ncbi:alpha-amylase [Atopomonas hussainii]|uniref:alpha-amylase n=1 Tax=Atopomonas hussainii TaxID=1429083 RepID=UPI0009001956|nr:alpha-amylase [Atopomonas hussainii]
MPAFTPVLQRLALLGCLISGSAYANPPLTLWLDNTPLAVSWQKRGAGFEGLVSLTPGQLHVRGENAQATSTPLAPYRKQAWQPNSHLSMKLHEGGQYRVLWFAGDDSHLRLLPEPRQAQASGPQDCQADTGAPLTVNVSKAFADGTVLRDALSQQTATVQSGSITLTPAAGSQGLLLLERAAAQPAAAPFNWRNATVYFALTDRFANGNPDNDHSYGRQSDGQEEIGTFHGGDLQGLTSKLDYLAELGVNALWISAPYEQIHGWVGGGDKGDFRHYAYHGYYALDYTRLDANMGTPDDLRALIKGAHQRGIRVLFDVVMNHPGYSTLADMQKLTFGGLRSGMQQYLPKQWSDWQPESYENLHAYHNLIDYDHTGWAQWWGKDWVRAGIADYDNAPSVVVDPVKGSLAFLPDFKTESQQPVALPDFLKHKADTGAVERYGYSVRDYLVEWLSQWVAEYGVDGFRADTVKHVEPEAWAALRQAADKARAQWSAANPDDPLAGTGFWMAGEVFGHGPEENLYQDHGFDALINFAFQKDAAGQASECLRKAEPSYQHYSALLAKNAEHNFLSYASSHDTSLFYKTTGADLARQQGLAAALLLAPGAVQIYYGDETARPMGPSGSDPQQGTRSSMNWSDLKQPLHSALLKHWQTLGQFRARHPAIGAGQHKQLSSSPYSFMRKLGDDTVVIVQAR